MGIKSNFTKFIKGKSPTAFETIHISEFAYKKIAVDISLYMHKFKAVAGEKWISCFLNLVGVLRDNEIHAVFIYDGESPKEKNDEQQKRRNSKIKLEKTIEELENKLKEYYETGIIPKIFLEMYNKKQKRLLPSSEKSFSVDFIKEKIEQKRNQIINVSKQDFELTKELFKILNVPYYIAPSEAEKMCSKLFLDGKVDGVLSEDSDVIAYGANLLSNINTYEGTVLVSKYNEIINNLKLDRNEFLDFCILCGTDYNNNIPNIGSATAYKNILKHRSIDMIEKNTDIDISILKHNIVRNLFTNFLDYGIDKIPYCGRPDFDELIKFSQVNNLDINIDKLKKQFIHIEIIFED